MSNSATPAPTGHPNLLTRFWHSACSSDIGKSSAYILGSVGVLWTVVLILRAVFQLTVPESILAILHTIGKAITAVWNAFGWLIETGWFLISWPFIQLWYLWVTYPWYYLAKVFTWLTDQMIWLTAQLVNGIVHAYTLLMQGMAWLTVNVPVLPSIAVNGATTNLSEILYLGMPLYIPFLTVMGLFWRAEIEDILPPNPLPLGYYPIVSAMVWVNGMFTFYAWFNVAIAMRVTTEADYVAIAITLSLISTLAIFGIWHFWNRAGDIRADYLRFNDDSIQFTSPAIKLVRLVAVATLGQLVIWGVWVGSTYWTFYPQWMGPVFGFLIPACFGAWMLAGIFGCGPEPKTEDASTT